jgi:hypothetical protein
MSDGIYSSLGSIEKNILNLTFFYAMFVYFKQERADLFLNVCWAYLKELFSKNSKESICKLININNSFEIFKQCIKYRNNFNITTYAVEIPKGFYFYLPSYLEGTCEKLFISYAKYLAEFLDFNVNYIDYKDGFAATKLKGSKVKLIPFYNDNFIVENDQNYILSNIITSVDKVTQLSKFKHSSHKVLLFILNLDDIKHVTQICKNLSESKVKSFINIIDYKELRYLKPEIREGVIRASLRDICFLLNDIFEKGDIKVEQNKKYEDALYDLMRFIFCDNSLILKDIIQSFPGMRINGWEWFDFEQ